MIYSKNEIINFITTTLNVDASKISLTTLNADGNMTAKLEEGGSDSLILVKVDSKEYVVKTKTLLSVKESVYLSGIGSFVINIFGFFIP